MNGLRLALASLALFVLPGSLVLAGPVSATLSGRNGRIAWAVFNAGGGGGGGFASLTTYPAHPSQGNQIGYCPEDNEGNVCRDWENVAYSPDGTQLLWDQAGASGTEVITLANSDAANPQTIVSDGFDDSQASFSRNGHEIVYVRQTKGAGGLFGTLVIRNLSNGNASVVNPSIQGTEPLFSSDGKTILFVRPDQYGYPAGLWSIRLDGHGLRRLVAQRVGVRCLPRRKVDRLRDQWRRGVHRARERKPPPPHRAQADRRPPYQRGPLLSGWQAHRVHGAGIERSRALCHQGCWR
jgi:hypothetical protein